MNCDDLMYEIVVAVVLVLVLAIFLTKAHDFLLDDRTYVHASDGRKYRVRNTSKKTETAEALARLNEKVTQFIDRLQNNSDAEYRPMAVRLKDRYRPETISEGRVDKRYTSYTVNKGEQVVLCLRSRDERDEIYDDNLIFYVALHELAHISSVTEDHSPEFHRNFRYLLRKASEWNMWRRVDRPFQYCGMYVSGM